MPALTISRLAREAGVGIETVRYYQRIGLLDEPPKPTQGYRVYPHALLARLHFIARAKQLGFYPQ
jgi:MerR family mercuric resistance operon transcriptional regulator